MPVVTFNHIPFVSAAEMIKGYTDEGAAPTTLRVDGRTTFRHVVSNLAEVAAAIRPHPWPVALGGHIHTRELVRYGSTLTTRFEQAAAIVGGGSGTGAGHFRHHRLHGARRTDRRRRVPADRLSGTGR